MNVREKALARFPELSVTLVSVVQAIAMEVLVGRVAQIGFLPMDPVTRFLVWAEISLACLTVFYVWVTHSLLVTMAHWVFRPQDFITVFSIGAFEFAAFGLIGPDTVTAFCFVTLAAYGSGVFIHLSNTAAAASLPDNADIVRDMPRKGSALLLGGLALCAGVAGVLSLTRGPAVAVALLILGSSACLFTSQMLWFRWWRRLVDPPPSGLSVSPPA